MNSLMGFHSGDAGTVCDNFTKGGRLNWAQAARLRPLSPQPETQSAHIQPSMGAPGRLSLLFVPGLLCKILSV